MGRFFGGSVRTCVESFTPFNVNHCTVNQFVGCFLCVLTSLIMFVIGLLMLSFYIGWAIQVPSFKESNTTVAVANDFVLIFSNPIYALKSLLFGGVILSGSITVSILLLICCCSPCLLCWYRKRAVTDEEEVKLITPQMRGERLSTEDDETYTEVSYTFK
jgi:hypothetical protein